MDEADASIKVARDELRAIEDAFADVDPDDVEVSTSDGVLAARPAGRHARSSSTATARPARSGWPRSPRAWHFDPAATAAGRAQVRRGAPPTLTRLLRERIGLEVAI